MGLYWSDILGTVNSYLRIGKTGPRLKDSSGAMHVRDAGDSSFASAKLNDLLARHVQVRNSGDTGYVELEYSGGAVAYTQTLPAASGTLVVDATMQWRFLSSNLVPSAVSSVDFTLPGNGQANSEYAAYKVLLSHVVPATDGAVPWVRTSTNGGTSYDNSAGNYSWAEWADNSSAATNPSGSTSDTEYQITGGNAVGNDTGEMLSGEFILFNPDQAKYGQMIFNGCAVNASGNFYRTISAGRRAAAADVDAIRIMFSSGNIASGAFHLYGLRASAS